MALYFVLLNAPGAFHSKRFNLEMNAGGVLFYLTPGAAYRENLGPLRSPVSRWWSAAHLFERGEHGQRGRSRRIELD